MPRRRRPSRRTRRPWRSCRPTPPTAELARVLSGLRPDPDAARSLDGIDGPVRAGRRHRARGGCAPGRGPRPQHVRPRPGGRRVDARRASPSSEAALAIAREVANADDIGRAYVNLGEARACLRRRPGRPRGHPRRAWLRPRRSASAGHTGRSSVRMGSRTDSTWVSGRRPTALPRPTSRPIR